MNFSDENWRARLVWPSHAKASFRHMSRRLMKRIQHDILIAASARRVYGAIATADGISTWWDKQTSVNTEQGVVLEHSPGAAHGVVRLRVVDLVPDHRIEWECISIHPAAS